VMFRRGYEVRAVTAQLTGGWCSVVVPTFSARSVVLLVPGGPFFPGAVICLFAEGAYQQCDGDGCPEANASHSAGQAARTVGRTGVGCAQFVHELNQLGHGIDPR